MCCYILRALIHFDCMALGASEQKLEWSIQVGWKGSIGYPYTAMTNQDLFWVSPKFGDVLLDPLQAQHLGRKGYHFIYSLFIKANPLTKYV